MMRISEIKNVYEFVELSGNSITTWNRDAQIVIKYIVEEHFDFSASIDNKTFKIIQKLVSGATHFRVDDNKLIVSSNLGRYTGKTFVANAPNLTIGEVEYTTTINTRDIKQISKSCGKNDARLCLNGIIFYDNGSIVATDSFKGQIINYTTEPYNKNYSVPVNFFDCLPEGKCKINFNSAFCQYNGDDIIARTRMYATDAPNILKVLSNYLNKGNKIKLIHKPEYSIVNSEYVKITIDNGKMVLCFIDDNDVVFETEITNPSLDFNFSTNISYDTLDLLDGDVWFNETTTPITIVNGKIIAFTLPIRR